MAKYRILALDGGGLRGLITARLLQRLNDDPDIAGWLDKVDLIAGTSTGGILALALAKGLPPDAICDLYIDKGPKIFDDSIWDNVRDLGKTIGADYSNKVLRRELTAILGKSRLRDLKTRVTIPTFDLDNEEKDAGKRTWKPKIFHNFPGKDSDGQMLAVDVAMYTSAAPSYFPSVDGYIDGGVYANNPTMVALAQAISQKNQRECACLDDIVLLSVGTGVTPTYIEGQTLNWGYAQWIKPLINILMDGVAGIADYQARQLLGDHYARLQIVFGRNEDIALDDVKKIARMDEIATNYADLHKTRDWIREFWV